MGEIVVDYPEMFNFMPINTVSCGYILTTKAGMCASVGCEVGEF